MAERERMELEPYRQVHISPYVTMVEAFLLSANKATLIMSNLFLCVLTTRKLQYVNWEDKLKMERICLF